MENQFGLFVKHQRTKAGLSQKGLSEKTGVSLKFIRTLETDNMKRMNLSDMQTILTFFHAGQAFGPTGVDAYALWQKYRKNRVMVGIKGKNGSKAMGYIVKPRYDEHGVLAGWTFVTHDLWEKWRVARQEAKIPFERIVWHWSIESVVEITEDMLQKMSGIIPQEDNNSVEGRLNQQ